MLFTERDVAENEEREMVAARVRLVMAELLYPPCVLVDLTPDQAFFGRSHASALYGMVPVDPVTGPSETGCKFVKPLLLRPHITCKGGPPFNVKTDLD